MNRKESSLKAARVPAPVKRSTVEEGHRVGEEEFGAEPGARAVQWATLPCHARFKSMANGALRGHASGHIPWPIPLAEAMRILSAEFWLRLGEPLEALAEIESLPPSLRRNRRVHKLHGYALQAARLFQDRSFG